MAVTHNNDALVAHFGSHTALAQATVPALYRAAAQHTAYAEWVAQRTARLEDKATAKAAKAYGLVTHKPERLLFALQSYYALLVKVIAAQYLAPISNLSAIESGTHFRAHGLHNFISESIFDWYLEADLDLNLVLRQVVTLQFESVSLDAFKALYHDLLPQPVRHALGEYYTPDWLAQHTLARVGYKGQGSVLDPACGSGTFLAHAVRRLQAAGCAHPLQQVAGIDVNPLACLAARATLLLATGRPKVETTLPIYCADTILHPPALPRFDFVVGNPPWVNWQTLPAHYRAATKNLWAHYGLFTHDGMESILGKGKKDLSLLLTYRVADCYLRDGGKLAFIITQSALKSGGAGDGFRRFQLPEAPLRVLHVDDLSHVRAFENVSARAAVLTLQKGTPTRYPVPYTLWRKPKQTKALRDHHSLTQVKRMTRRIAFVAEPLSPHESQWLSGKRAAIKAVRKLLGRSDYRAHSGVYTGGANGVYWLEVLEDSPEGLLVRNIVAGAKRPVPQVEAVIEPDWVYPFLRGTDVQRWCAAPSIHILMVQDVHKRRGYDADWLQAHYPRTAAYLAQFEPILRQRAAYKRYFQANHPFYTMFNVGTYTLAPYKVVWNGMGKQQMQAAVVGQQDDKPILSNQAMHPFVGLQSAAEAHYLAACLNSAPFEYAVLAHTQVRGKSFAQPGILNVLRVPAYQPQSALHQHLIALSQAAHAGRPDDSALAEAASRLWGLSPQELADLQDSLLEWR